MRADDNTRKILISVAEAAVNLFVALILVSSLLYFILVLLFGVDSIDALRDFTTASKDIMLSLLIIVGVILILAFLVMFIRWLSKDEEGIMILAFEVAAGDDTYSGKAISQLVTAELLRISRIHDPEVIYKGITPIESERLSLPVIAPSSENLTYTVTQMGPVGLGMTSIHIGPLMAILKRLWPGGDNGQVISGSLQRYGSVVSMVACLEHKEIRAWEASCGIEGRGRKGDDKIPGIAKDLAFKIIHDLKRDEISANSWQGFKYFTEALDAYRQYNVTGVMDHLERARTKCLKAADSETHYEKLLELLYNLGMAYSNRRELSKAEELLFEAISIKQDYDSALFGLGYLYGIQDRHNKAHEYFGRVTVTNPKDVAAWSNKGTALRYLERKEEALVCFDKALDLDPKYVHAWNGKGNALRELGKPDEALVCFDATVELDPRNSNTWYLKGLSLGSLNRWVEALLSFDKALDLDPKNSDSWYRKGVVLGNLSRWEEALQPFEKAIALDPKNASLWQSKAFALDNLGKAEDSIQAYEKAAELGEKSATLFIALARLYRKLGREADGIEACKSARDLIEKESEYNRACFEAVCGSPDAALDLLRTALEKREQTADWARQDPDLEFIRDDPRFAALLDEFSADGEMGS
jgi:tetratricopeptide (TPR) repeat protein